jgi:hypothetical protein
VLHKSWCRSSSFGARQRLGEHAKGVAHWSGALKIVRILAQPSLAHHCHADPAWLGAALNTELTRYRADLSSMFPALANVIFMRLQSKLV